MIPKIKVGLLISYDFNLIFNALPRIYDYVDEIYLSYDKNFLTWSGKKISIPEDFFGKIKEYDRLKKIKYHIDNFYIDVENPIINDTIQRNLLKKEMGYTDWCIQIDVDEYFINFSLVRDFLLKNSFLIKYTDKKINIRGKWVTLFKKLENGYLFIDNDESFSFVNNAREYNYARNIDGKQFQTNFYAIHQSWAREESEVALKISNWGHKNDFDTESFFNFWKNVNSSNYMNFKNFHPVYPQEWEKLEFIECNSIDEFEVKYKKKYSEKLLNQTKLPSKYYFKYLLCLLKFWK
ncbi:hypothetical protein [Flavobacterium croceum]|uniref:Glycosyl transferase family 2 n=1 Tax=Flavobacterium croceum DSM 17960 TaxID=1121886 RepID=A0A2S4N8E6_9FLAO|nr:hypothetical protein [Flavobacterium croceum]POS01959.1 hypothetical protein Q361_10621 [Flavobacterium croceum DSM 17960]